MVPNIVPQDTRQKTIEMVLPVTTPQYIHFPIDRGKFHCSSRLDVGNSTAPFGYMDLDKETIERISKLSPEERNQVRLIYPVLLIQSYKTLKG